jgi:hypothetical protein
VSARFEASDKLSEEDRKAITEIAGQALASFQPKSKPDADPKPSPAAKAKA